MSYKHILFDLDGTITDSGPGIRNAVSYALAKHGIDEKRDEKLNLFIGPPLMDSFMGLYGYTKEEAWQGVLDYREYYLDRGIHESYVYDGIAECLSGIKDAGFRLSLATSKPISMAETLLTGFGLIDCFDTLCGASLDEKNSTKECIIQNVLEKNKEFSVSETLMVGDRMHDILGAKHFGIDCAAVLWGYGNTEEFMKYGAKFIVKTPAELSELIISQKKI